MSSPYINTELYTHISLQPNQMDNKLYINLKKNLENKVLKKCYKDKGYIMEVYKILDYNDGIIEAENPSGSAIFDVKFSCRLCIPLKGKQIICKTNGVNRALITASNGPILLIITSERINSDIFFPDKNNNLRYKKDDTSQILETNVFIKVTILSTTFNNNDNKIKAIGFLNDIATEAEIESYYNDLYNDKNAFVNYKEYMEENEKEE